MVFYFATVAQKTKATIYRQEEVFANHRSDKGPVFRIYKKFVGLRNKKDKQLNLKIEKGFEHTFLQKTYTNDT